MINRRDVIRMYIPYPNMNSKLAVQRHMYVCYSASGNDHSFVKCQTLKPHMLFGTLVKHYVDEKPDITRNPFVTTTRIDCDKLFTTSKVVFDDQDKTTNRPDVSVDVMNDIDKELAADGFVEEVINASDIISLNTLSQLII